MMMEIVYGTTNSAKLDSMRKCLCALKDEFGIGIIGLNDLDLTLPDIAENGKSPLDNARIKAQSYYNIIRRPVFSLDSGLYFLGLPDALQPGINVRRVNGKRLSDSEMIEYYSGLAGDNGGRLTALYRNGICLIVNDDLRFESMSDDIASEKFYIADTPHVKHVEGFPLDSLSIHIRTGKYYYDLKEQPDKEGAWQTDKGFNAFFRKALSESYQPK